MRIFKLLVALALLAGVGLVGFAYLGDLSPRQVELRVPVDLVGPNEPDGQDGPDGS